MLGDEPCAPVRVREQVPQVQALNLAHVVPQPLPRRALVDACQPRNAFAKRRPLREGIGGGFRGGKEAAAVCCESRLREWAEPRAGRCLPLMTAQEGVGLQKEKRSGDRRKEAKISGRRSKLNRVREN